MINRDFIFYWLRWTLLIPLSIGAGMLVSSIIGFILSYIVSEPSLERYKHALNPLITSFLSLIIANWIAPKYKSKTTIAICSMWLLAVLFGLFIIIAEIKLYGDEYELKDGGMAITMVILGLTSGCFLIWKRRIVKVRICR